MIKFKALLVGKRIVVPDKAQSRELYRGGFYGRFVSIRKVKDLSVEDVLEISLMEAVYLVERGVLEVYEGDNIVTLDRLIELGREEYSNFDEAYKVYKDLRSKGYVVKSGIKFGATFAVYEYGPGIDHAPFLVYVYPYDKPIDPLEIVRAGRLSHSVRKKFVLATLTPKGEIEYYSFQWFGA
ncbi:MAG: tRNA-intron lyase [Thermoprotei archaeon]|nr:MAG: tRNA-intron lyase [Thermoprotei archaeon]RLF02379.1 MAG: tRNA-intron lyase [Thermoprotei archaeon]